MMRRGTRLVSAISLLLLSAVLTDVGAQSTEPEADTTSTSTQQPVNKGAARQMFGSGSLRQTQATPGAATTELPSRLNQTDDESIPGGADNTNKSSVRVEQRYVVPGGHGHGSAPTRTDRPYPLPADFYGNSQSGRPRHELDEEDEYDELPTYRNGAPVHHGVRHSETGSFGQHKYATANRDTGAVYGAFDAGYEESERSRYKTSGFAYSHGVGQHGEPGYPFPDDRRTLVQELEDEGETKVDPQNPCKSACASDQFLCSSTCTCIAIEDRCNGNMDCENADDERNCETFDGHQFNESCPIKRPLRCPISGKCIAKEWLCDGENDCGDFSDESRCGPQKNCTAEQFECKNGLCLPQNWVCDGKNDCRDYSDELVCKEKKVCFDTDFVCLDGTCIFDYLRCNGQKDCIDGSDELKCEEEDLQCRENQFQCAYPRCISLMYRCDGDDDCGDGSDEENCPSSTDTSCNTNEYKCSDGTCITKKWVCDKEFDCKDGGDEQNCQYPTPKECKHDEFTCQSGMCIPQAYACDGIPDCSGGEDEQNCHIGCELTQYMCKSSTSTGVNDTKSLVYPAPWLLSARDHSRDCISLKHVCDGVPDCPEKDDEENCPKKVACSEKDKCNQLCVLTSDNQKACACEPGYVLGKDNATCEDIDECKFQKDPPCSQLCKNTKGSFICECAAGYILRPDLRSCKALGANPSLLLANRVDIRQASISGPKYTSVLKGLHNAIALDYHYKRGLIFWSDVSVDVIRRVYINGTDNEDFIRWGLESPGGIAVDWVHDLLFWTDAGTRRVEVMTIDTRVRHVLISSDLDKPRAIAVHPDYGYVYWTDWGPNPKIERAEMDGSRRTALITDSIHWPNGLTIDYTSDRIYWIDAKHRVIESAHIHGTDRKKVVARGLHHPFAITVFEDSVFWTDWHFKSISLANKNNGRGFKTIHSNLHFPMDLHSYHPQRQPEYANHCGENNGKCSHMCLPNNVGYSCVCPVGLKIKKDGKTCAASADNLLLFARKKDLRLISLDQSAKAFDIVIPVDNVLSAVALAWNSDDDTIFWTDVEADTISRASLDGTKQQAIIHHNLESPAGLALDWVTKKLYWTDAGTNRIECSNLDGSMRTLLIHEDLDKPRDIVVDPTSGYMYWSDWGEHNPKIEIAGMDGSARRVLIGSSLTWPNGLAIDFEKKRLYWADGGKRKIEYSDLDGKHRTTVVADPNTKHPFGLVIHKDKIFWTDWDTMSIHRADKDTGKNASVVRSDISGLMDVRVFHRDRKTVNNPCSHRNGGCSHLCLLAPAPQLFRCACPTGLLISPDERNCPDMPFKFLLMSHRVDIRILSLDTNYSADTVLPMGSMKNVSGADVDLETGDIYWTDPGQPYTKTIKKAAYDGQSEETVVDGCISTVDSLVVDSVGRKLYWTDVGLNSIEVSELDGKNRKVLVWNGLDNPRAIALHYPAGLFFWTDWGHNARIERADLDGDHRTAVVTEKLTWPNGLSIDLFADRIYWNDAKLKVIESSDLTGQNRKTIVEKVEHPYGLAVVGDYIYWSDWHAKALSRAKKDDGKNKKVVLENLEGIMDIRLIDKQQVRPENACGGNNGGCSHLCLKNPEGFTCACPTGIILNNDKRTCNSTPSNFLLLATKKTLVRISLDTPEMWEVPLPVKHVHNAFSVDFHWEKRLIFYTDVDEKVIRSINMRDFNDIRVVIWGLETSTPFRIAVDWVANNIYWTDMKHRLIEVARIDGSSRKKLIENLKEPRSLAVFPREGYLFWAEWGEHPRIARSNLDGGNKRSIVSTDLSLPNGLSIDYAERYIYWADALKDRIEKCNLHGNYRVTLIPEAINAFGLTQYGHYIYWGDWFKEMIEKADKRTSSSRSKIRTALDGTTDIRTVSSARQTGWTPCAMENGGCSHLCLFTRKGYTCACPDQPDSTPCSTVPRRQMPLRKPGTENDTTYDVIDDEMILTTPRSPFGMNRNEGRIKDFENKTSGSFLSTRVIITITVIMLILIIAAVGVIIYLQYPPKNKRDDFLYNNRRNVLTFSNPNYNASAGSEVPSATAQPNSDKKNFIWKRLKYDKSQERVYEDNGLSPSPEVMSLIPSATPTSSRAASVTPLESSPPAVARISSMQQQPSLLVAAPKPRPLV